MDVVLELESVFVEVFEDEDASLCAKIPTNVACAIEFPFEVNITLSSNKGIYPILHFMCVHNKHNDGRRKFIGLLLEHKHYHRVLSLI